MQSKQFEQKLVDDLILNKSINALITTAEATVLESKQLKNKDYEHYVLLDYRGDYPFPESTSGTYRIARKRFAFLWVSHNNIYKYKLLQQQ